MPFPLMFVMVCEIIDSALASHDPISKNIRPQVLKLVLFFPSPRSSHNMSAAALSISLATLLCFIGAADKLSGSKGHLGESLNSISITNRNDINESWYAVEVSGCDGLSVTC